MSREFKTKVLPILALLLVVVMVNGLTTAQDGEQAEEMGQLEFGEAHVSALDGAQHFVVDREASVTCGRDGDKIFFNNDEKSIHVVCHGNDMAIIPTASPVPTTTPEPAATESMDQIFTYPAEELSYRDGFVVSENRDGFLDDTLSFHNYSDTWIDIPLEYTAGECFMLSIKYSMGHADGRMMSLSFGGSVLPIDFESTGGWGTYAFTIDHIKVDAAQHDMLRLSTVTNLDGPRFDVFEIIPSMQCEGFVPIEPTPELNRSGY